MENDQEESLESSEPQETKKVDSTFPELNWNSKITFGKHVGKTFIMLLTKEKKYLKWCVQENLISTNPEIKWIWEHLKQGEKSLILHGDLSTDKLKG